MVDITRTALGTATSKTSGTTLALASVAMKSGASLVVGVAYDTGQGAPVVTWGNRTLSQIVTRSQSGAATALFLLRHINEDRTRTITCAWSGAITAKAMFATQVQGVKIQDVDAGAAEASTADPTTGTAATSTQPDTIQIAAFGSQGPSTDTLGTIGEGHTAGQRAGTTGAPPASNVTIQETYEILTATGDVRATQTTATARTWANVILAIKESIRRSQGIGPSDQQPVEAIFETAALDANDIAYKFNPGSDQWEAFDLTTGTLRAIRANSNGTWAAP